MRCSEAGVDNIIIRADNHKLESQVMIPTKDIRRYDKDLIFRSFRPFFPFVSLSLLPFVCFRKRGVRVEDGDLPHLAGSSGGGESAGTV